MTDLGFKQVTADNWLEPDPMSTIFVSLLPDGQTQPTSSDEWLQLILEPQLADAVPEEVRRLFEVARGAMVYGYLFYPLYTLAAEQLFRVADAAVFHKCKLLGYQEQRRPGKERDPLAIKIDWLIKQLGLTSDDRMRWQSIRQLRNYVSHPDQQTIMIPAWSVRILRDITENINQLFDNQREAPTV